MLEKMNILIQTNNGPELVGIKVHALLASQILRAKRQITKGLCISEIFPRNVAERIGLQCGDVVLRVDDMNIRDPNNFKKQLEKATRKDEVSLIVKDRGPDGWIKLITVKIIKVIDG